MAPKKVSESATSAEPRRSGRIATQPAPAVPEPKPKAPKATKKRTAEDTAEASGEGSLAKKVRRCAFYFISTMDGHFSPFVGKTGRRNRWR